ncbi:MAG: hypothetical protein WAU45_20470 [Blastocatellia bacterium]
MIRHSSSGALILVAFLVLGSRTSAVTQEQPGSGFTGLITAAEAVVAVEILSTDYTATPSDGPMMADAKVLKVLKGPLTAGKKFSFWETAWVGPAYQKGEHRILFLEQAKPTEPRKTTRWWILSNLYARTDFFIEKDSIAALSADSLASFLKEIQESNPRPKKVVFAKK